ncbi:MAG: translocation/assembly module TamB [Candidatus Coatesbacteria bacterium]|nr:MAG: translocation/assembly module TamB [Candidatus Coatesbacteria bacterium]
MDNASDNSHTVNGEGAKNGWRRQRLRRRLLFGAAISAAAAVALAAAAYFSGLVHVALRRVATAYLTRQTGVECGIGRLEGDLFTSLNAFDFYVANGPSLRDAGPALAAEEIHLRYGLPSLLRGVLLVKKARVVNPYVMLRTEPDGRTNLERIFDFLPERREEDVDVRLDEVVLENGSLEVAGDGPLTSVVRVNVRSSLEFKGLALTLGLGNCSCYIPEYELAVANFGTGELRITPDGLHVNGVDLALDETSLTVDGKIETSASSRFDLVVKAEPLSLTEIVPLLAPDAPPFDIRGNYEGTLRGPANGLLHTGSFHCPSGSIGDYELADTTVKYAVDVERKEVRLDHIAGTVNGLPARLTGTVDLATETPAFRGEARLERFNLARIHPASGLETRADVTALFEGRGSSAEDLDLTAKVNVSAGFAGPVRFDGAAANLRYYRFQLFVDEAMVRFGPGIVSATGVVAPDNVELTITARDISLADLPTEKVPVDVAGDVTAYVRVYGAPGMPSAAGEVVVEGLAVEGVTVASARIEGYAERLGGYGEADVRLTAGDIGAGPFSFERSQAEATFKGGVLTLSGAFENDAVDGDKLHFDVWHDSYSGDWELSRLDAKLGTGQATLTQPLTLERERTGYVITGGTLALLRGDISFSGSFDRRGGPLDVVAEGEDFRLDGLKLWPEAPELSGTLDSIRLGVRGTADAPAFYAVLEAHDFSVGEQPVDRLRGEISLQDKRLGVSELAVELAGGTVKAGADFPLAALEGEGDTHLKAEVRFTRFPLSSVVALNKAGLSEGGYVDGVVTLAGTGASPALEGNVDVSDAVWGGARYGRGRLDFGYAGGELRVDELSLVEGASRRASLSGTAELSLAGEAGSALGALALLGEFDELELRILDPFIDDILIVGGTVSGKVDVGGSAASPALTGRLEFAGGAGTIRPLRSTFSNLGGVIDLAGKAAVVSSEAPVSFDLDRGRGRVWGYIGFEAGQSAALDLTLVLEDYTFGAITGVRALCDVSASLGGSVSHPRADAEVRVKRGFIATDFGGDIAAVTPTEGGPDFRVHVDAPGNVWLRNKNLEIELEADVTVRKTGPATTIAGDLTARRGSFFFLARDFAVERGDITFTGTQDFDPVLDLRAKRTIRAARAGNADAEVTVDVTGTFKEPEFWFSYRSEGGTPAGLSQSEIMELLVLDVTHEDLNEMSGGSLASKGSRDYVRRMAQAEVSRAVRRRTGLDVFEYDTSAIGAERGTRYGRVTVGKYVSSELYVSYTTEYSEDPTGAGERKRSAEVDYELYKDFYLVGTTFEEDDSQRYGLGLRFFYKY